MPPHRLSRWPRTATAVALAPLMGLVACSGASKPSRRTLLPATTQTAPSASSPASSSPTPGTPSTVDGGAARIAWSPCNDHAGWQCGTLQVPLDHIHPATTIGIALNRHAASDPAHRVGSLLINPGGPGASGVAFAYDAVAGLLDPVLVRDFDVVGFDPRGVGASDPVACVDGPTLDRLNHLVPAPTSAAALAALEAGAKELDAGCASRSAALLAHVSTVDAARDLDDIRAALGDAKLTYLGFSYGTLLGATYASLYPTHVRALSLDGAIDPSLDEAAVSLDQAAGFEQDLDDFLADCTAKGAACAFHAAGAPSLRAAFDAVVERIAAHPLPGSGARTVGPGEALTGIIAPLYDRNQWPTLAQELADAQAGNGKLLLAENDLYLERSTDGTYDNEQVANIAVTCLDQPPSTVTQLASLAADAAKVSPYFGPPLAWASLPCTYWPVAPTGHPAPLRAPGAPPILVVGSTGDPVTPYAWAKALAGQLGSGVLVTRHGDGHAAYPFSPCVRAIEDTYLVAQSVPRATAADCAT